MVVPVVLIVYVFFNVSILVIFSDQNVAVIIVISNHLVEAAMRLFQDSQLRVAACQANYGNQGYGKHGYPVHAGDLALFCSFQYRCLHLGVLSVLHSDFRCVIHLRKIIVSNPTLVRFDIYEILESFHFNSRSIDGLEHLHHHDSHV